MRASLKSQTVWCRVVNGHNARSRHRERGGEERGTEVDQQRKQETGEGLAKEKERERKRETVRQGLVRGV